MQIAQVTINFIASMQYNTFRQAEGVPMATTFATNHIRQIGIGIAVELKRRRTGDKSHRPRLFRHIQMLVYFVLGAVVGTVFCHLLSGRAIWISLIPLGVVFAALLHADLTTERDLVERKFGALNGVPLNSKLHLNSKPEFCLQESALRFFAAGRWWFMF